jgi:LmbE family N-acetylglucosaminyl deacetylase
VDGEQAGFGTEEELITHSIDVRDHVEDKLSSMRAHASQIGPDHFFLTMEPERFAMAFGQEWFIEHGASRAPGAPFATDLFAGAEGAPR